MDIKSSLFVCLTACVVFTLCFILIRSKGASVYSVIVKALASFSFVMTFLVSLGYEGDLSFPTIAIGIGLVAGLIGDILLDLKVAYEQDSNEYLVAGFVSFGVGHLFYIFALIRLATGKWSFGGDIVVPIAISVLIAVVMAVGGIYVMKKFLKYDFGKHTIITAVYSFVLFFVTCLAMAFAFSNPKFASFAIGLILFSLSDLILSMQYFGGQAKNNLLQILNHSSYYLAQIVIACTVFISILI